MRTTDHLWPPGWDAWAERTLRRMMRLFAVVTVIFVVTDLVARSGRLPSLRPVSFHQLATDVLFAIGFGSPIVLYVSAWPPLAGLLTAGALGVAISAVIFAAIGAPTTAGAVMGLGLGCLLVLARDSFRGARFDRLYWRLFLLPAAVALVYTLQAAVFLNYLAFSVPLTFDGQVYVADGGYGFQPSFAAGRLFAALPALAAICYGIYAAPPPILLFVYALQVRSARPPRVDGITMLLVLGLSGYAFYFFYPVTGPLFAFGDAFPHAPPAADSLAGRMIEVPPVHPIHIAWRNAMPSLHFGSVLLALWLSRPLAGRRETLERWPRLVAGGIVAGTALATLGLGEHYAIDLVVALPFTLTVYALMLREAPAPARHQAAIIGAVLVGIWYVVLFTGTTLLGRTPLLLWPLTLVTLVTVVLIERRLARAITAAATTS